LPKIYLKNKRVITTLLENLWKKNLWNLL
jgi:hypothetical protein